MVDINISVSKGVIFLFCFVFVVGFVFAFGGSDPPVMGHSGGEVEINIPGVGLTTLQDAITNNQIGSTPSTLGCTVRTNSGSGSPPLTVTASCNSGEVLTGGGCSSSGELYQSYPSGSDWICSSYVGSSIVIDSYAICCVV